MKINIQVREVETSSTSDFFFFAKWFADPEYRTLTTAFRDGKWMRAETDAESLRLRAIEKRATQKRYVVLYEGEVVGDLSFELGAPQLLKNEPLSAFVGIGIGEKKYRGKGIGREAFKVLENKCWEAGAKRIELGVFAFNTPAIALYKSLGYKEFSRIQNLTEYENKMWDDIRMEKYS